MKGKALLILIITNSCVNTNNLDNNSRIDNKIENYISDESAYLNFPFSDATIVNNVIYVSGQVGNIAGTSKLVEGGIINETIQTMKNIEKILESNGSSMDNVFKCTCMLSDISDWDDMNNEYRKFFKKNKSPSRSSFAASALALGAKIEIECWAIK